MDLRDLGDEGGAQEIPPDPQFTDADPTADAANEPKFKLGDMVTVAGEREHGEILELVGHRAQVRFYNRFNGNPTTLFFALGALTLVRSGSKKRELKIFTFGELVDIQPPEPLIDGVLSKGTLAFIYGPPGCAKTFLALSMSLSIAAGILWFGRAVASGPVLYIAAEGVTGIRKRVRAWLTDRGPDVEALVNSRFLVIERAVDLSGDDVEALLVLIAALRVKPVLVVIDTLARCSGGAEENSAQEMGRIISACDRIVSLTGGSVLVVHHTNKAGEVERGSSALRGAADAMIKVSAEKREGAKFVLVEGDKAKDDEELAPLQFKLDVVQVGFDERQRPVTSCRLIPTETEPEAGATPHLTAGELAICRTLRDRFWEQGASASQVIGNEGVSKATFYRHIKGLETRQYVIREVSGKRERFRLGPSFIEPAPKVSPVSGVSEPSQTPPEESQVSQVSHPPRGETVRRETSAAEDPDRSTHGGDDA